MTRYVHLYLLISAAYVSVGTACLHNPIPITMLRFPEDTLLSTRDHP